MWGVVVWICGVVVCLLFPACASSKPPIPTHNFVRWSQKAPQQKKQICVLPFENTSHIDGLAEKVRRGVAGHISVKRFADAELYEIDTALAGLEDWRPLSPQALGRKLHCDALVYGRVSRLDRLYIGVYSQLALEGTIQIVAAASGRTLVHDTYTTRFHDVGLPLSPIGFATSAVQNLRAFTSSQFIRAIDDLSRNLAFRMPDLPENILAITDTPNKQYPDLTKPVRIAAKQRLTPQSRSKSKQPVAPAPTSPSQDFYRVQVAAFSSHDEAQHAAKLLRDEGYTSAIAEVTGTQQAWHRVVIGPFLSVRRAREIGAQIKEQLPFEPIVTQGPLPAP